MKLPQYEVKTYQDGFENQIVDLFSVAFNGRKFPLNSWQWRFKQNPCLNERLTTLWDGEKLIAHNGLTPFFATFIGKQIVAANSGTTMAREEYMGVSIQLFEECNKQNQDIDVIYGFPNKNSFRITTKYAKHLYLGDIAFWECKTRKETVAQEIKSFECFDDKHESIYQYIAKEHDFIINRTKSYLNWRFVKKPDIKYDLFDLTENGEKVGYIVINEYIENNQKQLQVIDFAAKNTEYTEKLLRFAINESQKRNCEITKLWMTSDKYKDLLLSLGFKKGNHLFPMTSWRQFWDLSKSYITMADSDVF